MSQPNWNDETIMPFGKKYKGMRLIDIPDEYFEWFWNENLTRYKQGELGGYFKLMMQYIEEYFDIESW